MIKFTDFQKEAAQLKKPLTEAFSRVLESGWYILGDEVSSFEKEFAKYLGVKYCIGVGNGLEALQISLMALGIGESDEVITTPISAVATTLAILAVGATPIFVDTDDSGLINANQIESAITKKTKAILPVHLYGQPTNLKKIQEISKKHKLFLVEDACQAHGSSYQNKKLGSFGDINCFSFYPTKNLGALGDGGLIATNNQRLAEICYQIRDYGQSGKYIHARQGLNSRLDELQAALLKVKLKFLDKNNQKRKELAKRYLKNLEESNIYVATSDVADSNFHQFVIRVKKREALQKFLKEQGIPTAIHYPTTIPDQPFLSSKLHRSIDRKLCLIPISKIFVKEVLSLPCHPYLKNSDVDFICEQIIKFKA